MRAGCLLVALLAACGDPGPFEFRVWANDYTGDADIEVLVDGTPVSTTSGTTGNLLATLTFPDYGTGLREGLVVIETRSAGEILATCEMRPGACGNLCYPEFETSSVCISPDGSIGLNTYGCPCGGGSADWFCSGDCSITGPGYDPP